MEIEEFENINGIFTFYCLSTDGKEIEKTANGLINQPISAKTGLALMKTAKKENQLSNDLWSSE